MIVRAAQTAELDSATLRAVRRFLDDAFDGGFSDHDWEHALGGVHALVWEGGELVAHGAVVQRRLLHADRALRTGYVEAVAVRADRRRCGYGAATMDALERVVRGDYELGALSASDGAIAFYAARAWQSWRGPTFAQTPDGVRRTADEDGGVFVLPLEAPLDVTGELVCDWRAGDVW